MPEPNPAFDCPACRLALDRRGEIFDCSRCGRRYPVEDGIADFSEGRYYDRFTPGQPLSAAEEAGLANEVPGAEARIRDFYLPLLEPERKSRARPIRVLDSGCGNGLSVDLLHEAGVEAWGVDLSALRKWQWRGRMRRDRLACARGERLPFSDAYFDAVLCSGVLEHVGVRESGGARYRVEPLAGRDEARLEFLAEQARVLAPGGALWLDFPNGAFPIDFWHGPTPGAPRWHSPREGFLPLAAEVRRYARALPGSFRVRVLGAAGRLQFRQVERHWYGKLLRGPASLWLRLLGTRAFAPLRETACNPFLVMELRRESRLS
jgi:SAM-dependent methyltransferase